MSDALEKDNNANIIRTFSVSNLSDRKIWNISYTLSKMIIWLGRSLIEYPWHEGNTLGWLPTGIFPIGSWNIDISDLWVTIVMYCNLFSSNSAIKSTMSFISGLVGDISCSEHQPHHFFQADLKYSIEDILFCLWTSKFCLRLFRLLVALNFALQIESTLR